jgi:hypothetical protein
MIIGRGKVKYSERNLSHCHSAHHKFHMDCPGLNRGLQSYRLLTNLPSHGTLYGLLSSWPCHFNQLCITYRVIVFISQYTCISMFCFRFFFQVCYLMMLSIIQVIYCQWWTYEWVWSTGGMMVTGEKPKFFGERERDLSQCYSVHHKHHMDWPGIEPGLTWWETGD